MESLDYRHHTIHVNKHTAHYESDGSVRVVVSHTDPGVPNWIETAGHQYGYDVLALDRRSKAPSAQDSCGKAGRPEMTEESVSFC